VSKTIRQAKGLSGAQGWPVEAAARAAKAGWSVEQTLPLLERIRAATFTLFTPATLKYLIHGGRVGHLKGLVASVLNIKPLIGIEKEGGTYVQHGQTRTLKRALLKMADFVAEQHAPGSSMRLQVFHGDNSERAATLRERLEQIFDCAWLPTSLIAPVLGAHTGPGLVGLVYAPQEAFAEMP